MAAQTFASMVPDISAFLQGCPNATIERTLRKITTDLCQRGRVWRVDMTDSTLVPLTTEYAPASPVAYGEFMEPITAYVTVAGVRTNLRWATYDKTRRLFPDWPMDLAGSPLRFTSRAPGRVMLAPTPDTAGTLSVYGTLRPTTTADSWEDTLYREFHRTIYHGVLHELMMMQDRSWSDQKLAAYHGKQWTFLLAAARDRAERDFSSDAQSVEMRPFA